jgi:RimJ/RimL family protein N-acetyltransferase
VDLVGELVRLRALRPVDAEPLLAIGAHPEVARFAGPPSLPPEAAGPPGAPEPDAVRWVVECRGDGAVIGAGRLSSVDFRNRNAWLELVLGPPARWGQGCGTEAAALMTRFAFRQLGLEKVYASVCEEDERSLRVCRRTGFRVEAALARHRLLDGRLVTELWLATYRDGPRRAGSDDAARSPLPPPR